MFVYLQRAARAMAFGAFILFGFLLAAAVAAPKASANDLPVVYPSGPIVGNETWEAGNVYMLTGTVSVPDGASLVIEPGAIIKSYSWGIQVEEGGVLSAIGTSNNPIVFTSYKDDSSGGDSNGDGQSIAGALDYYAAVQFNGGGGTVSFATVRAAYNGLTIGCATGSGNIGVADNTIESTVAVTACAPGRLTLERNNFNVANRALVINTSDPSFVVMTGQNKNTFAGTPYGRGIVVSQGAIASGKTWTVDTLASGASAILAENSPVVVAGVLNMNAGSVLQASTYGTGVLVDDGGVANFNGTAANKVTITDSKDDSVAGDVNGDGSSSANGWMDYSIGVQVEDGGSLDASHTLVKHGVQSVKALGGTVNIDNSEFRSNKAELLGSTQASLDNVTIHYSNDGLYIDGQPTVTANGLSISDIANVAVDIRGTAKVILRDTNISAVNNGVLVSGSAQVSYRGSFDEITDKAIRACNWGQGCFVDAAYTDWGSEDGPYESINHTLACGYIFIYPWVNMEEEFTNNRLTSNCDGSYPPDQQLSEAISYFQYRVNQEDIDCSNGFQDACDVRDMAMACLAGAVNVAASTSPIPLQEVNEKWQIQPFHEALVEDGKIKMAQWSLEITLPGKLGEIAGKAVELYDLYQELTAAYNQCTPN